MSLGIAVKGPEGIVLAADTRVTLNRTVGDRSAPIEAHFDNASKLLTLGEYHSRFAAVTYGRGSIAGRTAHSLMPEFEQTLDGRCGVAEYARLMGEFFMMRWVDSGEQGQGMSFIIGGVNPGSPFGEIYTVRIPEDPVPLQNYSDGSSFGMVWGGQLQIVNRLIQGYDPSLPTMVAQDYPEVDVDKLSADLHSRYGFTVPYGMLPLQDCVDLAAFLIRTTITAQNLSVGPRGVGGTIEIVTITPTEGTQWLQKRQIRGERV